LWKEYFTSIGDKKPTLEEVIEESKLYMQKVWNIDPCDSRYNFGG
jgi:hypothetical protein